MSSPDEEWLTLPAVQAAIEDPRTLFKAAEAAGAGWSEPYGGPEGVARLAEMLREDFTKQASRMASLRSTAVSELLRTRSMAEVGKTLGISKQAVHKITNRAYESPFRLRLTEGQW